MGQTRSEGTIDKFIEPNCISSNETYIEREGTEEEKCTQVDRLGDSI